MAIEGNDWWAIAGAAAGGLVVGAIGAKLAKSSVPSEPLIFMGIRRWYEVPSTEDVRSRALATVWEQGDDYWLRVYVWQMPTGTYLRDEIHFFNLIEQGAPFITEEGPFDNVEEAMYKADSVIEPLEMEPITDWGYPSEKVAQVKR
jgi:hypothetical protein